MSKTRALIFWGGWDGHDPEACAAVVTGMLQDEGVKVKSVQDADVLRSDDLTDYALIVPMMTQFASDKEGIERLCAAVRGGVGLGGFHGGMGDAFRDAPAYQFMVGGQWVAHPGDFIDYRVEITRPDHPLMEGIESFEYHSEQYFMHVDPANEVLATTTFTGEHAPEIDGTVMPVFWTRQFGAGRVFYSALGHNSDELTHPQAREVLRRGLIWAASSKSKNN